jgi:hypothetical protein
MKQKHRLAIVYLPTGADMRFTTKDLGDATYQLCEAIEGEADRLNVVYKEDGKLIAVSWVGYLTCSNYFNLTAPASVRG